MANTNDLVETTGAKILARFVMPVLITLGFSLTGWTLDNIYDELVDARKQIIVLLIEQGKIGSMMSMHERRLDTLERRDLGR